MKPKGFKRGFLSTSLTLYCLVVTKVHTYLNRFQLLVCLSMHDILLPPNIEGLAIEYTYGTKYSRLEQLRFREDSL